MKNKNAKRMICDVFNFKYELDQNFKYVWLDDDRAPCLICFKSANFMWPSHGVVSLTADQLRGK
ncbi:hypothetical protein NVP1091O_64 [Vibrio phage 1.091.O._10N.286.52.B12]|nr:hypothetical protein NVP1091O_64 [Vibrio phage 1.091.O._10N.286.52.B12]